jgi:hypothetical protein
MKKRSLVVIFVLAALVGFMRTPKAKTDSDVITVPPEYGCDWTSSLASDVDECFGFDVTVGSIEEYHDLVFRTTDAHEVALDWSNGVLDIQGDPNDYTEAARLFLLHVVPQAAEKIVAADPNALRRLCASGAVCSVMGHCWRDGRPGEGDGVMYADYHPNTMYRTCRICGKCESCSVNDWQ